MKFLTPINCSSSANPNKVPNSSVNPKHGYPQNTGNTVRTGMSTSHLLSPEEERRELEAARAKLARFKEDQGARQLSFPTHTNSYLRRHIHEICDQLGLAHESQVLNRPTPPYNFVIHLYHVIYTFLSYYHTVNKLTLY
jgi:hypothetical protein